jgi:hypothetical protein
MCKLQPNGLRPSGERKRGRGRSGGPGRSRRSPARPSRPLVVLAERSAPGAVGVSLVGRDEARKGITTAGLPVP